MNDRLAHVLILLVCVAATFGRLCSSEFTILDDNHTVSQNRELNPPTAKSLQSFWTRIGPTTPGNLYVPLTYTLWAGLAKMSYLETPDARGLRLNPWVFHTANVAVHILTALTAYALLNLLMSDRRAALFGALVYALHPVMVEPVGWVSGMKDLLAGLFTLLAIYLYVLSRRGEQTEPRQMRTFVAVYVLAMVALLAAMLSKPSAMTAPLLALAIDRLVLARSWKSTLLTLLPWFMLALACAVITKWTQPPGHVREAPIWARALVAGDNLVFCIRQIIFPLKLCIDYGRYPTKVMQSPAVYFTWLIPAAIGAACWFFRRRAPLLLLGAIWFVAALLPVLGFVSFQFQAYSGVADHYLYLPMFGVAIAVAWVMKTFRAGTAHVIASVILVLLAGCSFIQAAVWKDSESLFQHTVRVNPHSFIGWTNLAYEASQKKDWDKAITYTERALPLGRNLVVGIYENLAIYLIHKGDIDRAIKVVDDAIAERYASPMPLRKTMTKRATMLGILFHQKGHPDQARRLFEVVKQDAPSDTYNNQAMADLERSLTTRPATTRTSS